MLHDRQSAGPRGRHVRSLDDRMRVFPRAVTGIVALLLTVAAGAQLLASRRLAELQAVHYPALEDARVLAAALHELRSGAGSLPQAVPGVLRAEEVVARARAISRDSRSPAVREMAERVEAYAATAGSAPVATRGADSTASALEDSLASLTATQDAEGSATLGSARASQLAAMLALLLGGGATLLAVSLIGDSGRRDVDRWVDEVSDTVGALADGAVDTPIPAAEGGAAGRLHEGLRRLAIELHSQSIAVPVRAPAEQVRDLAPARPFIPVDSFDLSYAAVRSHGGNTAGARRAPDDLADGGPRSDPPPQARRTPDGISGTGDRPR